MEEEGGGGGNINSILYHITIFYIFGILLISLFTQGRKSNLIFIAILTGILYAVSDEYHQLFVPGRHGSGSDVLLDTLGITLATLTHQIHQKLLQN